MTSSAIEVRTGHVGLNVSDLARSIRFYQEVFGFGTILESEDGGRRFAFLGQGEDLAVTLWQQSEGGFDTARPGLHHLSFEVETLEQVNELGERAKRQGAGFLYDGVVPHAEGEASGGIFFTDPDGIRLEVFVSDGLTDQPAVSGEAPACGFF